MIAIVISACLSTQPAQCDQRILTWWPTDDFAACRQSIEPTVVLWSRDHRGLVVQSAWCQPGRPGQDRSAG